MMWMNDPEITMIYHIAEFSSKRKQPTKKCLLLTNTSSSSPVIEFFCSFIITDILTGRDCIKGISHKIKDKIYFR